MDKELKIQRKKAHQCVHCGRQLVEEYTIESCPKCRKILKLATTSWRWRMTIQIFDAYGWKCACCGCDIPEFLTVDHKLGGGNEHRKEVRKSSNDWYKFVIENNFPPEFQILCFNCNLGRQRNGGICPHEEEI